MVIDPDEKREGGMPSYQHPRSWMAVEERERDVVLTSTLRPNYFHRAPKGTLPSVRLVQVVRHNIFYRVQQGFLCTSNSLPPPTQINLSLFPQFTPPLPSLWKEIGTCRRRQLGCSNAMELHMGVGFLATAVFYRCLVQCSWTTKTGNLKSPRRN